MSKSLKEKQEELDKIYRPGRFRLANPSDLPQDVQDASNVVVNLGYHFTHCKPRATEEQLKDVRWQLYLNVTDDLGPDSPSVGTENHELWKKSLKEIDSLTTLELIEDHLEEEGYDSVEFLHFFGIRS